MICKGGAEPPMFAQAASCVFFKRNVALLGELFVSLEVPGQNSMVSRDSPLA